MALASPIQHIVVLMLENRSFDHLLGDITETACGSYNSIAFPHQDLVRYAQYATDVDHPPNSDLGFDPDHSFAAMMRQMFGQDATGFWRGLPYPQNTPPDPGANPTGQSGYAADYYRFLLGSGVPPDQARIRAHEVMAYFENTALPVLAALANGFVVCDNWFCDVPAYTYPNRLFMHAATSLGDLDVSYPRHEPFGGLTNPTIYNRLDELSGLSPLQAWAIFSWPDDECDGNYYDYTFNDKFRRADYLVDPDFLTMAANGTLPFYSFLMPVLNSALPHQANSMHPPSDVRYGENYIATVYNTLRNSPTWESTLLIITYDENGAIYDHVVPPITVPPDDHAGTHHHHFDFSTLGPRIPALLISPWLKPGCIDSTQYQNTSVLRFVQDLCTHSPLQISLTERDKHANSIANAFGQFGLPSPRTDCPGPIPIIPGYRWNTQIAPIDSTRFAPSASQIEHAKSYLAQLPGHPDSGKPLTREFASYAELNAYRRERRQAARKT